MNGFAEMHRRELLGRAIALLGAASVGTLTLPAIAQAADAARPYLDKANLALLSAVADTMVPVTDTPGALAANVPAVFDGLLRDWAAPQRRTDLVDALKRIDAAAREQKGKGFVELTPADRTAFLTAYDIAALKPAPAKTPTGGGVAALMAMQAAVVDPTYAKLKELIVLIYYMSEIGLTKELSYEHAPGKWQPSVKITPETRPAGGSLY